MKGWNNMITINDFLDNILRDFMEYVDKQERLCDLLDVHFDAGRLPDYSNVHVQQLYLLRYAYAYAFEYKYIYHRLIEMYNLEKNITVTSIGCGNLLDYWSLAHVVKTQSDICYRGIDTIDWSYKIDSRSCDDVECTVGNACTLFKNDPHFPSDIYIFPKSISEFSEQNVHELAKCFTKRNISKNVVHFIFSLRFDSGSKERDINKTKIFYDKLIECGFHTNDTHSRHLVFNQDCKDKCISSLDYDFRHPGNVVDYIKELYKKCSDFDTCNNESNCKSRLGRWPILKCRYAAWQIFTFER